MTYLIELDKNLGASDLGYFRGMQPHSTEHDHEDFHHVATDHKELVFLVSPVEILRGTNRATYQKDNEIDSPTVANIINMSFNFSEIHCNRRAHSRRPTERKTIVKRTD